MTTYIILSRFSPEAFEDPKNFRDLAATVSAKIKKQCPDITWKGFRNSRPFRCRRLRRSR